jgi:starvation-inducible DNA-binding protein
LLDSLSHLLKWNVKHLNAAGDINDEGTNAMIIDFIIEQESNLDDASMVRGIM